MNLWKNVGFTKLKYGDLVKLIEVDTSIKMSIEAKASLGESDV